MGLLANLWRYANEKFASRIEYSTSLSKDTGLLLKSSFDQRISSAIPISTSIQVRDLKREEVPERSRDKGRER